jgi:hypothetical protein
MNTTAVSILAPVGPKALLDIGWQLVDALRAAAAARLAPPRRAMAAHRLDRGATLRVARPAGVVVVCLAGTLWITHDGAAEDIVLEAGERHLARNPGRMLVHAMDTARVLTIAPGARAPR